MPPLAVTAVVASLLALIFFRLSLAVIGFRRRHRVSLGSGGHDDLERAIRAQGNFAEYTPITLVLLACLEVNGAPWWLVAVPGAIFIAGRLIHARGVQEPPPNFSRRVLGMKLTLFTLAGLAALNLSWLGVRLVMPAQI
jgi:uncharacterized membrane protein YecN with MAPEG domain